MADAAGRFLRSLREYNLSPGTMQPAFGMAETCTCITYNNAHNEKPSDSKFVDLGPPIAGVEVRITDKLNQVVPAGVEGRLQVRGSVVTPGYLFADAANAESFVGEGWFNSGDLGFIKDGELTLTGREKEMIIIRGANYYCYEIETVVENVPGVRTSFVAATSVASKSGTELLMTFFVPTAEFPERLLPEL